MRVEQAAVANGVAVAVAISECVIGLVVLASESMLLEGMSL